VIYAEVYPDINRINYPDLNRRHPGKIRVRLRNKSGSYPGKITIWIKKKY
jgi:hypothetical protein